MSDSGHRHVGLPPEGPIETDLQPHFQCSYLAGSVVKVWNQRRDGRCHFEDSD
jgi:hypothetical protein